MLEGPVGVYIHRCGRAHNNEASLLLGVSFFLGPNLRTGGGLRNSFFKREKEEEEKKLQKSSAALIIIAYVFSSFDAFLCDEILPSHLSAHV